MEPSKKNTNSEEMEQIKSDTNESSDLDETGRINSNHDNSKLDNLHKVDIDNEEVNDCDSKSGNVGTPSIQKNSSVWKAIGNKISITEKGATPVNWKIVGLVLISLFSSAFSLTFLFPFLPEMILFFGYQETDKGYYAGIIASAVFAGRAVGSYFWGWLSDKKGRRSVMIFTVLGNGVFSLLFGFTQNLAMAFASRFLTGLFNGTVGVAKTILYEVSDDTNQAISMSIIGIAWGSGIILGPTIGGLLASPATKYPHVFDADGVFGHFPYLLPSLLVFGTCLIVAIIDLFLLPETIASKQKEETVTVDVKPPDDTDQNDLGDQADDVCLTEKCEKVSLTNISITSRGMISLSVEDLYCESDTATYQVKLETTSNEKEAAEDPEHQKLLTRVQRRKNQGDAMSDPTNESDSEDCVIEVENSKTDTVTGNGLSHSAEETRSMLEKNEKKTTGCYVIRKLKSTSIGKLLSLVDVREAVFLYTSLSFAVIGFDEIFTVWASTERGLGGLGYDPARIGMVLGITAVPMLIVNIFLFPWLVKRFQLKNTFLGCCVVSGVVITLIPLVHLATFSETVNLILLMTLLIPQKVLTSSSFSATSLFVNNSAPPSLSGAVNGIAMTVTAIARTIAPAAGGSIFAWSVGYGAPNLGPPFDISLSFFIFGFVVWVTVIYGIFTSESLNKQKKPPKEKKQR